MVSLAIVWLVSYFDRVNLSVAIIPMQAEFGWLESQKGVVLAAVFLGYISSQIVGGWLTLYFGAVRLLTIALIGFSTLTLITPMVAERSMIGLMAVRVVLGAFEGLAIPASYTLIGRWSHRSERARMLAIVLCGATLGAPLGLTASGVIVETYGWRAAFYVFGVMGLVWAALWSRLAYDDPEAHPRISPDEITWLADSRVEPRSDESIPVWRILRHPAVLAAAAGKFSMGWTIYVFIAWLPSYFAATHAISLSESALFSALPWVTLSILLHPVSWQADRMIRAGVDVTLVRKSMQTIGIGGTLIFLLLVTTADSVVEAVCFTCGATGCLAFCYSGVEAAMVEMAPRYRGFITGFASTVGSVPGVVAVPTIGWIVERTGSFAGGFVSAAIVGSIGMVVWLVFGTGKRIFD